MRKYTLPPRKIPRHWYARRPRVYTEVRNSARKNTRANSTSTATVNPRRSRRSARPTSYNSPRKMPRPAARKNSTAWRLISWIIGTAGTGSPPGWRRFPDR